jgi:hypothetical protein
MGLPTASWATPIEQQAGRRDKPERHTVLAQFRRRSGRLSRFESTLTSTPTLDGGGGLGDGKPAAARGGVTAQATLSPAMNIVVQYCIEQL